jgi:SIR2-like domain
VDANLTKTILRNMKQNSVISPKATSQIIFFLGAGASIPAGIQGVQGMVKEFKHQLNREKQNKFHDIVTKLEQTLKNRQSVHLDVNIEELLEAVERIENSEHDILSPFYNDGLSLLTEIKNLRLNNVTLSTLIKNSIKQQTASPNIEVKYLEGLLDFLVSYKPLHIFSTNYDVVMERFCERYHKIYSDGFVKEWDTNSFHLDSNDVCIYKLHGSVTWSRSEKGRYSKNEIVVKNPGETQVNIITGDLEVPLILYPGKKLEYFEPVFDTFMELKSHLSEARYVFVFGYSFRDDHIRKLFQYEARRNIDSIVILVSPSAHTIYEKKLKYFKDEQFIDNEPNNNPKSDLDGRVVCLPYRVEDVLPYLKKDFFDYLKRAEELYRKHLENEPDSSDQNWTECLKYYSECEHFYKVDQIVNSLNWFNLVKEDWVKMFKVSFQTFFNSIPSRCEKLTNRWKERFRIVCEAFQIDMLKFTPLAAPKEIKLEFKQNEYRANITAPAILTNSIDEIVLFLDKKEKMLNQNSVAMNLKNNFIKLNAYFKNWTSGRITHGKYYDMRRKDYPINVEQLETRMNTYVNSPTNKQETIQRDVIQMIEVIELQEMLKISNEFNNLMNEYRHSIIQSK